MHFQHLKNFIENRLRKDDIYIPGTIFYLVKNEGVGSKEEIARLIYIFEYKHSLEYYEKIVDQFASTLLEDYNLLIKEDDNYKLITWPLKKSEVDEIISLCYKKSNGFFKNLQIKRCIA